MRLGNAYTKGAKVFWFFFSKKNGFLLLMCAPAQAADLGQVDGLDVRWDTTLRETLGFRTESAAPALLANINADDGDRAFRPGLNSARLDVVSEVTAERGDMGFDLSAQAWYDPVYYQHTANASPQTFNPLSVPYQQHPADVQTLMGGDAELLDAFVKDRFEIGDTAVSVRVGRQTLLWGESLFFPNNGIAAGQAPVDDIKALSAPLAQARELYLPVAQAVARIELGGGLALEAYDQFEWRRDRLPGVTSYFSTTDILDTGGQRVLLPGYALYRTADSVPRGPGQFGVALRLQGDAADFGLYALRYDAKLPQPVFDYAAGTYRLVFPTGINVLGASASTYVGDSNLAGEVSVRQHMPLVAGIPGLPSALAGAGGGYIGAYAAAVALALPPVPQTAADFGPANSGVPTGDTWHAQASLVSQLAPTRWFQAATLQGEIAANDLLGVTGGHAFVQPGRSHFAAELQAVFTPSYYRVLPGLDISLPVGIAYTPVGRSSIDASENAGAGNVTAGLMATYHTVWQVEVSFTHFIGGAGVQKLGDRDFAAVSLTRAF